MPSLGHRVYNYIRMHFVAAYLHFFNARSYLKKKELTIRGTWCG